MDIAGDLAALKQNLAKFKKGKMKGLEDIDINELDWVKTYNKLLNQMKQMMKLNALEYKICLEKL